MVWKLAHSCETSIILFLYPLCEGLLVKLQCSASWLSSLVHVLRLGLWLLWFVVIRVPEQRPANICRMTHGSPILTTRRAPADHDTQTCYLGPTLCNIVIGHFNHGCNIVSIPDPGVFYDLRAWYRCDKEQSWWLFVNSGSPKRKKILKNEKMYIYIYIYITVIDAQK